MERPLQLICDLEVGGESGGQRLNPEAPEFKPDKPEEKQQRRAKVIARDQIKGVAVHEDDEP